MSEIRKIIYIPQIDRIVEGYKNKNNVWEFKFIHEGIKQTLISDKLSYFNQFNVVILGNL